MVCLHLGHCCHGVAATVLLLKGSDKLTIGTAVGQRKPPNVVWQTLASWLGFLSRYPENQIFTNCSTGTSIHPCPSFMTPESCQPVTVPGALTTCEIGDETLRPAPMESKCNPVHRLKQLYTGRGMGYRRSDGDTLQGNLGPIPGQVPSSQKAELIDLTQALRWGNSRSL